MRGLKLAVAQHMKWPEPSHLLQMRGLKPPADVAGPIMGTVASFTDAWIETTPTTLMYANWQSHLLQMRGLKHLSSVSHWINKGRIFYRCVD